MPEKNGGKGRREREGKIPVLFPDRPAHNEKERKGTVRGRKKKVGDRE